MRYPYKVWVKMIKTQVQLNTTTMLNVKEMVTMTMIQQAGHIPWV